MLKRFSFKRKKNDLKRFKVVLSEEAVKCMPSFIKYEEQEANKLGSIFAHQYCLQRRLCMSRSRRANRVTDDQANTHLIDPMQLPVKSPEENIRYSAVSVPVPQGNNEQPGDLGNVNQNIIKAEPNIVQKITGTIQSTTLGSFPLAVTFGRVVLNGTLENFSQPLKSTLAFVVPIAGNETIAEGLEFLIKNDPDALRKYIEKGLNGPGKTVLGATFSLGVTAFVGCGLGYYRVEEHLAQLLGSVANPLMAQILGNPLLQGYTFAMVGFGVKCGANYIYTKRAHPEEIQTVKNPNLNKVQEGAAWVLEYLNVVSVTEMARILLSMYGQTQIANNLYLLNGAGAVYAINSSLRYITNQPSPIASAVPKQEAVNLPSDEEANQASEQLSPTCGQKTLVLFKGTGKVMGVLVVLGAYDYAMTKVTSYVTGKQTPPSFGERLAFYGASYLVTKVAKSALPRVANGLYNVAVTGSHALGNGASYVGSEISNVARKGSDAVKNGASRVSDTLASGARWLSSGTSSMFSGKSHSRRNAPGLVPERQPLLDDRNSLKH